MSLGVLEDDADPNYTHFAHRDEFLALLEKFLEVPQDGNEKKSDDLVKAMGSILDAYLPLPGLVDPHLHEIVPPLMARLARGLRALHRDEGPSNVSSPDLLSLGRVINWVVKVRGWKAVVQQFPSDIHFLPLLVDILSPPSSPSSSKASSTPHHPLISDDDAWELRTVLLLWLALLLTVPFDLSALSADTTPSSPYVDAPSQRRLFASPTSNLARQVVLLSVPLLYRPGKEGAHAAFVLARLYSREDAAGGLAGFLDWAGCELQEGDREGEANLIASIFEFLAKLPTLIKPERLDVLHAFTAETLLPHLQGSRTASTSGLIRKLAFKATGRWWIAKIGASHNDQEVPEGIEEFLGDLMSGLGDKDTIVRYSAAKYLARITATLPLHLREQIVTATLDLFAGTEDEPVIETTFGTVVDPGGSNAGGAMGFGGSESVRGESRWHGVCLALAELARRGLIGDDAIGETVKWVLKALAFDLRRASHSVGANVRDAASYLLWSLSRACSPAIMQPYAVNIATGLICAACFDREVGVRRAASAAYQEGVGRLGIYPEGIDVLAKTDFYSVSVRRIAFTNAAVSVAIHSMYRNEMRKYLHNITLRHWDSDMRILGAKALSALVVAGTDDDLDTSLNVETRMLSSADPGSIHGGLLALRELASILDQSDGRKATIFQALSTLRASVMVTASAADIIEAACHVIVETLSEDLLASPPTMAQVDHIVQISMRRREPQCQEAVAKVYERLSSLRNCQDETAKLLVDLKSSRAATRQAAALCLGHIQYERCPSMLEPVVKALLFQLDPSAKADVETRRYAIRSLANIISQTKEGTYLVTGDTLKAITQAFIESLSDYSTDQRGDIGSWIRIIALESLGKSLSLPLASSALTRSTVDEALGGIVKQSVEKLEKCRAEACKTLQRLRSSGFRWDRSDALSFGAIKSDADFRTIDQRKWFDSAMDLLHTQYRTSVVAGLVLSIGSSIDSLSKNSLAALVHAVRNDSHLMTGVLEDLSALLSANLNNSRVFLPTIVTATKLVSADVVPIASVKIQASMLKIVSTATRGIAQIKSIERLTASMKLCTAILSLSIPDVQAKSIDSIETFLSHRFPRIRAMTAEQLYLKLSEDDVDPDLEELLLETNWTDATATDEAGRVTGLLRSTCCL